MRAMMLQHPGSIEKDRLYASSLECAHPAPDEVLIKVSVCGICRTDLHIIEGELDLPALPLVPGHQVVGVIEETGNRITGHKIGDRVGLPWMNSTCGTCDYCTDSRENLCECARFTGLHCQGGYAEYVTAPGQFVYPLPSGISDKQAAPLLCAGVIGYRTLILSGTKPGGKLGMYGYGASAHVTLQVARHMGCEVFVFTRSDKHRRHACELGAVWAGTALDDPGMELDAAIVFAPAGQLLVEALKKVRKGGTVVSAGIHMTDIPSFPYKLLYGERTVTSAANATYEDGAELLKLAKEIPIRTEVTTYSLKNANEALRDLKASRFNGAAVLVVGE